MQTKRKVLVCESVFRSTAKKTYPCDANAKAASHAQTVNELPVLSAVSPEHVFIYYFNIYGNVSDVLRIQRNPHVFNIEFSREFLRIDGLPMYS